MSDDGARYTLLSRLGEGAMGVVYRAIQQPLGREVAIWFVNEQVAGDPLRLKRFRR